MAPGIGVARAVPGHPLTIHCLRGSLHSYFHGGGVVGSKFLL